MLVADTPLSLAVSGAPPLVGAAVTAAPPLTGAALGRLADVSLGAADVVVVSAVSAPDPRASAVRPLLATDVVAESPSAIGTSNPAISMPATTPAMTPYVWARPRNLTMAPSSVPRMTDPPVPSYEPTAHVNS